MTTICPLDLMRDNRIDMSDFNAWIESPVDVNGDSVVDALDGLTIYNMME